MRLDQQGIGDWHDNALTKPEKAQESGLDFVPMSLVAGAKRGRSLFVNRCGVSLMRLLEVICMRFDQKREIFELNVQIDRFNT